MLPSRKIFIGATALITSQALQVIGLFGERKVRASIEEVGRVQDSLNGLSIGMVSVESMVARTAELQGTLRYLSVGGTVATVLGTIGLLLVLTGLYQLAILVENGGERADAPPTRPGSQP